MINTQKLTNGARVRISYTGQGFSGTYAAAKRGDSGEYIVESVTKSAIYWRDPVTGAGTFDNHLMLTAYQRRGLILEILA